MESLEYFQQIKQWLKEDFPITLEEETVMVIDDFTTVTYLNDETNHMVAQMKEFDGFALVRKTAASVNYDYINLYVSLDGWHFCLKTNVSVYHEGSHLEQEVYMYMKPLGRFEPLSSAFRLSMEEKKCVQHALSVCREAIQKMPEFRLYFTTGMLSFGDIYLKGYVY